MAKLFGVCGEIDQRGWLYMPQFSSVFSVSLRSGGTKRTDDQALFWSEISASHTSKGFETVQLSAALNTLEQTIVDVNGEGILTHVLSTALSASGFTTIRVTIDGIETSFNSDIMTSANIDRFAVGNFLGFQAGSLSDHCVGLGSDFDLGFETNVIFMPTPTQSTQDKLIGMKFNQSLKVTIQASVNISATAEMNKAAACYTTYIPEGL